jgi:hypothetical protein
MNVSKLPEDYSEYKSVDLSKNKSEMMIVNFGALLLGALMVLPAILVMPFPSVFDRFLQNLPLLLFFVATLFLYIILHEAIHGLFMKKLGHVTPHFGFKGFMYAYAASTAFFDKRSYLIIVLAPIVLLGIVLVVINLIVPATWFWFVYIIQVVNVAGAAGDIYVMNVIRKAPANLLVNDAGVSMIIYTTTGADKAL